MEHYLSLFVRSIFIDNMALSFFLGMCTLLAISKKVDAAIGLGIAVVVVQTLTVPLNNLLYTFLLADGALAWAGPEYADVDLSFLGLICYIGVTTGAEVYAFAFRQFQCQLFNKGSHVGIGANSTLPLLDAEDVFRHLNDHILLDRSLTGQAPAFLSITLGKVRFFSGQHGTTALCHNTLTLCTGTTTTAG